MDLPGRATCVIVLPTSRPRVRHSASVPPSLSGRGWRNTWNGRARRRAGNEGPGSMRILFVTQWFDPEPMFKGLAFAKALRKRGHEVEVLTGFPNYPEGRIYPGYGQRLLHREEMDGISVLRVPLYPSH